MKFLIMQFSPLSCHFIPLRTKYSPQCELHVAFKIPCVYDYIIKLCRTQEEVTIIHLNTNVRGTGQREAVHRKYEKLKLGGTQADDRSEE
jgi:hypothetical protein